MMGDSMMKLGDIVGHEPVVRLLRRSLADGRLPHALLFHGPPGIGKRSVARSLAAAMNCQKRRQTDDDCCGSCISCLKIARNLHPDVVLVTLDTVRRVPSTSRSLRSPRWPISPPADQP